MPYIDKKARYEIDTGQRGARTPGELNYVLSTVVGHYLLEKIRDEGRLRYAALNDAVGALEGAKLEMYRRIAGPIEDAAIASNGDIAPYALLTDPLVHTACGTADCCGTCPSASPAPDMGPPWLTNGLMSPEDQARAKEAWEAAQGPYGRRGDTVAIVTGSDAAPGYGYHDPGYRG